MDVPKFKDRIKPKVKGKLDPILTKIKKRRELSVLKRRVKDAEKKDKTEKKREEADKRMRKVLKKTLKEEKVKSRKLTKAEKKRRLKKHLEKAGWEDISPIKAGRWIFNASVAVSIILTTYFIFKVAFTDTPLAYIIVFTSIIWSIGFVFILLFNWMAFYLILDLKMYQRKMALEAVLPDFMQLTSANIRAGMPIDRALWYAVRPRFGILAKEIEDVAKQTFSGEDLNQALVEFSDRYDSVVLKRSISLLIEGIEAGGEVGDLLNKIASNIQETRIMKKEMAASVTTYVIFITFASVLAAPALFGLSYQLLDIINSIMGQLGDTNISGQGMGLSLNFETQAVTTGDFKIFAIACLVVTSLFSSIIIAIIKKGNIKEGLRFIPIFIIVTIIIFYMSISMLSSSFGSMF